MILDISHLSLVLVRSMGGHIFDGGPMSVFCNIYRLFDSHLRIVAIILLHCPIVTSIIMYDLVHDERRLGTPPGEGRLLAPTDG